MGFLKKLGQIILKGTEIWTGIAPLASMAYPGSAQAIQVVSKDLAEVAQVVVAAESFGQVLSVPGAEKARAAAPMIAQILLSSSLLAGRKIRDEAAFLAACGRLGGDVADVLNALEDKVVTRSSVA